MNVAERVLPIKTAYTGVSCANCMTTGDNLLACAKCKRVKYCGRACQRTDWKIHKHECVVINSFTENYATIVPAGGTLTQKTLAYQGVMEQTIPDAAKLYSSRYLNFLQYAKSCCVCGKNDFELPIAEWINCSTCQYGWCCSLKHYDHYQSRHSQEICDTYKNSIAVSRFLWNHAKTSNEEFLFVPPNVRTEIMKQCPTDWDDYFRIRCPDMYAYSQQGNLPPELLPASTEELSQPLTCLYAMYLHGIADFKDKKSLTIHIVGASYRYEIVPSCVWEEILHCLPGVKSLCVVFVGPEACTNLATPPITEYEIPSLLCCPTCVANHRTRSTSLFGMTYHDYRASPKFTTPDLIVAFNTGMYEEFTESWKTSLEVMLDLDVAALFTSYTKYEAEQDSIVLTQVNARLLMEAPRLNPFRVAKATIEPGVNDVFFHLNMYCMTFKGRA